MSRIVSFLARRHEVRLLTWEADDVEPFYSVPAHIPYIRAGLVGGRGLTRVRRILLRFAVVRRHVREFRPHVVLSFMDTMNLTALVACLGIRVAIVIAERIDIAQHEVSRGVNFARRLLYPLASRTVVQTNRIAKHFRETMRCRIAVIPNPIEGMSLCAQPMIPNAHGRFRIVALGRLDYQKGFDLLIDAFARIARRHAFWDLVIFGDGQERETLLRQAEALGIAARVSFAGMTRDPETELAASHIMAFPSRYEGFPNALGEGLAAGLPAVGFGNVSGVEDLIVDGLTGFLINPGAGSEAFTNALERLVEDPDLRQRLGAAARVHVGRWASEMIFAQWESLLQRAANEVNGRKGSGFPDTKQDSRQVGV